MIDVNTTSNNEILQENHYYAFGMNHEGPWQMNDIVKDNAYQYNGKELQSDHGLNWSDYGARFYDACVGRWMAVDPLAEMYPKWNPYNYVENNPITSIDPTGMASEDALFNAAKNDPNVRSLSGNTNKSKTNSNDGEVSREIVRDKNGMPTSVRIGYNSSPRVYLFGGGYYPSSISSSNSGDGTDPKKSYTITNLGLTLGFAGTKAGYFEHIYNQKARLGLFKNRFKFRLYQNGWGGNAFVLTRNISSLASGIGKFTFFGSVGIDGLKLINFTNGVSDPDLIISPLKFSINTFFGAIGTFGGPPGWIIGSAYFLGETFVPGGWETMIESGYQNTLRNKDILGSSWSPRQMGGLTNQYIMKKQIYRIYYVMHTVSRKISDDFLNDLKPMIWIDFILIMMFFQLFILIHILLRKQINTEVILYLMWIIPMTTYWFFNFGDKWKAYNKEFEKMTKKVFNIWFSIILFVTLFSIVCFYVNLKIYSEYIKSGIIVI